MTTFNSNDIYVFPCARAGGSSLASEYNFTHLSGRVSNKTSYVIGSVNNILQVVLDGYYFEIKTNTEKEFKSLCTKKLILWLETLLKPGSTNDWAHVTRRVCGVQYENSEDSTGAWTKLQDLDNLDEEGNSQFSALYAVDDTSNLGSIEYGLTYICLDLKDKTNWVDNIHKGIEDKLVSIESAVAKVNGQVTAISGRVDDADEAIEANDEALNTFKTKVAADYATKAELSVVDAKVDNNDKAIKGLTDHLDEIVAQGGEPNVIDNIKVNGVVQEIVDKAVDITVPVISETKVSQLNDGQALLGRTTVLETTVAALGAVDNATQAEFDAYKEVVTAAIAAGVAEAKKHADDNDANIVYDYTTLAGRVKAIEDDYLKAVDKYDDTELEDRVADLEAAINGKEIYAIAFDANDGTGTMAPVVCISDSYTLPTGTDIKFTPPEGKKFQAWGLKTQNEETGEYSITAIEDNKIDTTKTGNTIVYAMWAAANTET